MVLGVDGRVYTDVAPARSVAVRSLSGIVRIWSGGHRALALKAGGTIYQWGPTMGPDDRIQRLPAPIGTFTPE